MKKDHLLQAVIVLFSFCLVVALVLGTVNYFTAPVIADNDKKAQLAAVEGLIEGAELEKVETLTDLPATVTGVFADKNGGGIAVTVSTTSAYSSAPMQYAIGIGSDGRITKIKKISYNESKNFKNYPDSFVGKTRDESASTDAYSGVTYSSKAFKAALADAFSVYERWNGHTEGGPEQ